MMPTCLSVIVEYFPPRLGGDRRIYEIIKRLPRGYKASFIAVPPSYTLFIRKVDTTVPQESKISYEGLEGYVIGLPRPLWLLWQSGFLIPYMLTFLYALFKTMKAVLSNNTDIIITNNTSVYTGLMGTICSLILRKALLVEFNDLESAYTYQLVSRKMRRGFHGITKRLLTFVENFILRRGYKVTAHTEFLCRNALGRGVRDIVHIPDGVDMFLFDGSRIDAHEVLKLRMELGLKENARLCVYAGRIDESIGGKILYDVAKLLEDDSGILLVIVGEGDPVLTRQLRHLKSTRLIGRVSKDQVPRYLALADVILVPYPETVASDSVSPLKLFEGLAMGKPVIASNVAGISEIITDNVNGRLVSPNAEEWVQAIRELTQNQRFAHTMAENAKKTAHQYDWSILSGRFAKVLDAAFTLGERS